MFKMVVKPWVKLTAFWTTLAIIWMIVLPWLSRQPTVASRVRELDEQGINPSALYYSELEMMPRTILRLQLLHQQDEGVFWEIRRAPPGVEH